MDSYSIDKQQINMLEYDQFQKRFQFIFLQGLKGLEKSCQIQEKSNNQLYDYIEQIIKINIYNMEADTKKIDKIVDFCENLLQIKNSSILQLKYYSRYFAEESLGEPYCKYLMIFEYSESSVENEIIHLQKSKKYFKKSQMKKIFYALGNALDYYHIKGQVHQNLTMDKIMKSEDGDYKLLPPNIKVRNKNDFYYYSPEEYQSLNFRVAFNKEKFNKFKSEIFSLGLLILHIGTFQPVQDLYGKFDMIGKRDILDERLQFFQQIYGYHLGQIVRKCLEFEPNLRIDANDFKLLLDSTELQDQEKIWNESQKQMQQEIQNNSTENENDDTPARINSEFQQQKLLQQEQLKQQQKEKQKDKDKERTSSILVNQRKPSTFTPQYNNQQKHKNSLLHATINNTPKNNQITPMANDSRRESRRGSSFSSQLNQDRRRSSRFGKGNFQKIGHRLQNQSQAITVTKFLQREFVEDKDDIEDNTNQIFNKLPQEFQEEIDQQVSGKIKEIELNYDIIYVPGGNRYQGETDDSGHPHGWGSYWFSNGQLYEGQFVSGKQNGIGIYYWPNGDKYYGQFFNGQINGLGVRFYQRAIDEDRKRIVDCYYGEWFQGQNHGKGTFYWQDKAKFKGHFIQDNIYGKGTLIIPDQDDQGEERKYHGLWKDENGQGILVEKVQSETGINQYQPDKITQKTVLPTKKNEWKQISKIPQLQKTNDTKLPNIKNNIKKFNQ